MTGPPRRVAALYDIHGNLAALRAVLDEARAAGAELLLVGGDVLPGPQPGECLAALREAGIPLRCIRGNGERAVLELLAGREPGDVPAAYRPALAWVGTRLSVDEQRWIATWPATGRIAVAGLGQVFCCHATPGSDSEVFTRETPEGVLLPLFAAIDAPLVICGHTHMPFDRRIGRARVVNAGSVGMPFGRAGADWLLLGPGVEPRHTAYDFEAAAREIACSSFPGAAEFARRNVLAPPGEAEMLAAFAAVSIR